jgi:hypothetical protein
LKLTKTKQGLFVTTDERGKTFHAAKPTSSLIEQLNLADGDYQRYMAHQAVLRNSKALWATHCRQIEQDMQVYKLQDRAYFINNDINNKQIVYYANKGLLYQPMCLKVQQIQLLNDLGNCYADLPIRIISVNVSAFLTQDRFIINSSRILPCEKIDRRYLINDSFIVQQQGKRLTLQHVPRRSVYEPAPYQLNHEELDYTHNRLLTSNFNPLDVLFAKDSVFDNGYVFELSPDKLPRQNSSLEMISDHAQTSWNYFIHNTIKWAVILWIIIGLALMGLYLIRYRIQQHSVTRDVGDIMNRMHWLSTSYRSYRPTAPTIPGTQMEMATLMA